MESLKWNGSSHLSGSPTLIPRDALAHRTGRGDGKMDLPPRLCVYIHLASAVFSFHYSFFLYPLGSSMDRDKGEAGRTSILSYPPRRRRVHDSSLDRLNYNFFFLVQTTGYGESAPYELKEGGNDKSIFFYVV